jgi:hypothetical protein
VREGWPSLPMSTMVTRTTNAQRTSIAPEMATAPLPIATALREGSSGTCGVFSMATTCILPRQWIVLPNDFASSQYWPYDP